MSWQPAEGQCAMPHCKADFWMAQGIWIQPPEPNVLEHLWIQNLTSLKTKTICVQVLVSKTRGPPQKLHTHVRHGQSFFCQHRIGQTLTFCLVCLCNKMKSINHDLNCTTICWINVYACFCVFAEYIFYWHSLVLFWSHSLFSSLFSLRACNSSGCCCSGGQARGESPL